MLEKARKERKPGRLAWSPQSFLGAKKPGTSARVKLHDRNTAEQAAIGDWSDFFERFREKRSRNSPKRKLPIQFALFNSDSVGIFCQESDLAVYAYLLTPNRLNTRRPMLVAPRKKLKGDCW